MTKVNQIGRKLGRTLLKTGINVLGKSILLTPTETTSTSARLFIQEYYPQAKFVFLDSKYKVIPWEQWLMIDAEIYDITKKMWEAEIWDCDDKAYTHKYWTLRIFGIPQIIVHGHCYDKNGKWLFGHFFCMRIADGNLYAYEPEGSKWTLVKKGEKVWMKDKEYRPIEFEF